MVIENFIEMRDNKGNGHTSNLLIFSLFSYSRIGKLLVIWELSFCQIPYSCMHELYCMIMCGCMAELINQ